MAGRPKKNTVDYFPHMMGEGKKMAYIETKYGNDGYATWFKILETLAKTEDHYLNLNDEINAMYLCGKCRTTMELMYAIINDLVKLNVFDSDLWQHKILWSEDFIESIRDTYKRRQSVALDKMDLCIHLVNINSINVDINSINYNKKVRKEENRKIGEIDNRKSIKETAFVDDGPGQGNDVKPWQPLTMEQIETELMSSTIWHGDLGTSVGIVDPGDVPKWIGKFFVFLRGQGKIHTSLREAKSHCQSWIRRQLELGKTVEAGPIAKPADLENPNRPPDNSGKWLFLNGKWRDTTMFTNAQKRKLGLLPEVSQ